MQVSVETLDGLERKLTVAFPAVIVEEKINTRLKELTRNIKLAGFRPGKVPLNIIKKRFFGNGYGEVANQLVRETLAEAFKQSMLHPVNYPKISMDLMEPNKDFHYTAIFEVLPEISITELTKIPIEIIHSEVTEQDIANMLDKMRNQQKDWEEVTRTTLNGDKVIIDFEGFINDGEISVHKGRDFDIIIGSGNLIGDFEQGLVEKEKDQEFEIDVAFPKDYHHKEIAGKDVNFKVKIKKILEGRLPKLDDDFAKRFAVNEGGMASLNKDVEKNMMLELDKCVKILNKQHVFTKLVEANAFEVPQTFVENEIGHLRHNMHHRIFGTKHSKNERIYNFPNSMFEEKAKYNVRLRLLLDKYKEKHAITIDPIRVEQLIKEHASAYDNQEEYYAKCKNEWAKEIYHLVMEDMLVEKIIEPAQIIDKKMDYEAIVDSPEIKQAQQGVSAKELEEINKIFSKHDKRVEKPDSGSE